MYVYLLKTIVTQVFTVKQETSFDVILLLCWRVSALKHWNIERLKVLSHDPEFIHAEVGLGGVFG